MSNVTLQDLDLFKLLHLTHLSDEDKSEYLQNLLTLVFSDLVEVDLPQFMTEEEIDEFDRLSDSEETKEQATTLIRNKIPDFDNKLQTRLTDIKKELVRSNVEERIDINKVVREKLRAEQESQENNKKILDLEKERSVLEKTLGAIDTNDWSMVDSLITTV